MARWRTASPSVGASRGSCPQADNRTRAETATVGHGVRVGNGGPLKVKLGASTPGVARRSCPGFPPGAEEAAEHLGGRVGQDAALGRGPPVAGRLVEETAAVQHGAAPGIVGSPDHPADAGVADGARAHGARLQRDIESQVRKAIILQRRRRIAQSDDLGMGGRIMGCDGPVLPAPKHFAGVFVHDHGPDRHHASLSRRLRQIERHAHEPLIMDRHPKDNDKKPRSRQDDGARGPRNFADKGPRKPFDKDGKPGGKPRDRAEGRSGGKPAPEAKGPERTERIAKVMARAGIASRREVERLIGLGKVAVNGRILDTPAVLVKRDDKITVDGKPIGAAQATRVWRYHKPAGLITSHNDPAGRPNVFDALPSGMPRVISVGRLDLATEGLLLLTNDGELSRALELPDTALVRQYRARARGRITQEQ